MAKENISAEIPPHLSEDDDALTRYGRWASDRHTRRRCGSAERDYRPAGWEAVDRRRSPPPLGLSYEDLMSCQRALARVPDLERIILSVLYIPRRIPAEAQLRIMRIPARLSQARHIAGLRIFSTMRRVLHCAPPDAASVNRQA
jgi:hypothetical protein